VPNTEPVGKPSSIQAWIGAVIQTGKQAFGSVGNHESSGRPARARTAAMVAAEAFCMWSIIDRNASRGSRPQKT
jgi:hypothetical protein